MQAMQADRPPIVFLKTSADRLQPEDYPMSELNDLLPQSQIQKLQIAKQKLQAPSGSYLGRLTSYLRISCTVMQVYRQTLNHTAYQEITYSRLMKSLYDYDLDWWKHCRVTESGQIISDDPVIDKLLQPVEAFHQLQT
jgi:hypothetical protein